MRLGPALGLITVLLGGGCGGASSDSVLPTPTLGVAQSIVPGATLPPEYTAVSGPSNNNLDVVRHDGAVYLALRTSRDHFASDASRMLVLRSVDEKTWTFEAMFSTGTDVREPRLLSYKGRLFLFYAKLGTDPGKFEPQGMFLSERKGERDWTTPTTFYAPTENFIPWRAKVRDGRAWLIAYRGGEHIYDLSGLPIDVQLLVSDDGATWAPFDAQQPTVQSGGGSETDFDFDSKGDLYAVVRNEAGDATGWGSKICTATRDALTDWRCAHDSKKYDSPLVFRRGEGANERILLIGRRNVTDTGNYEQNPGAPWSVIETLSNLAKYSLAPKRCALWQVDRATLSVRFVLDLPGHGDTCFASVVADETNQNRLIVYNYSSPLDGDPNIDWATGQMGETRIYRVALDFATE